ncbi:double homeobox protein B-like [Kogia breviceps]|uniref:double homeobox protein B-like n=1 Tax=Kogia breviceps TaxID=27615 RepID=UPI002795A73D|nr:double homeobox protein B-like [Kogia breviceps]
MNTGDLNTSRMEDRNRMEDDETRICIPLPKLRLNSTASDILLQKEIWQGKIIYNQSQKNILQAWFEHDLYPAKASRKQLAEEIGIPESKIQIWFKNLRARQSRLGFSSSLGEDQTNGQNQPQPYTQEYLSKGATQDHISVPRSQSNILVQAFKRSQLFDIANRKTLAKQAFQNREFNSFSRNQPFLPVLLPSHISAVPCVIQGQSVMMQPMQAVQRGENSPSTLTLGNYVPVLLTMGGDPDTQYPFWPQYQEKRQDHQEQTDRGVLQLEDYSQPQAEHKKPPRQDLSQVDISYFPQWWDECCQALIAEWDPQKRTH